MGSWQLASSKVVVAATTKATSMTLLALWHSAEIEQKLQDAEGLLKVCCKQLLFANSQLTRCTKTQSKASSWIFKLRQETGSHSTSWKFVGHAKAQAK